MTTLRGSIVGGSVDSGGEPPGKGNDAIFDALFLVPLAQPRKCTSLIINVSSFK